MGAREMEKTHQLTYLHVDLTHWMRTKGTLSYLPLKIKVIKVDWTCHVIK